MVTLQLTSATFGDIFTVILVATSKTFYHIPFGKLLYLTLVIVAQEELLDTNCFELNYESFWSFLQCTDVTAIQRCYAAVG